MIEHPDERSRMGENARSTVLARFTIGQQTQKYLLLFEELVRPA